jgi:hypothetical protein
MQIMMMAFRSRRPAGARTSSMQSHLPCDQEPCMIWNRGSYLHGLLDSLPRALLKWRERLQMYALAVVTRHYLTACPVAADYRTVASLRMRSFATIMSSSTNLRLRKSDLA